MPQVSETQSLSNRVATGAMWMAGQTVASRIILLGAQVVLAWILDASDLGQISLVYTITSVVNLLNNPGIEDVVLQRQRRLGRWLTPAFWMALACSCFGAVVMCVVSATVVTIAKRFGNEAYGNWQLFWMTLVLALGAPLNALGTTPIVMLRSQMRFARISALSFFEVVSIQCLTVVFAVLGFGAYSFVLPMPIVAGARALFLLSTVRPPIKLRLELRRWPSLFGSTGWLLATRALWSTTAQGEPMLLGIIFANATLVGQYFFAMIFALQVVRILNDNLVSVLMPALNSLQGDQPRLHQAAERATRALMTLVTPMVVLQILLAGPVIRLVFAARWEPAIPIVQILSIGPLLSAFSWPMAAMINATGRFRVHCKLWAVLSTLYFLIVTPLAMKYGAIGAASGVAGWAWINACFSAIAGFGSLSGILILFRVTWPRLTASAAGALPAVALLAYAPNELAGDLMKIFSITPFFLLIYFFLLRQFDHPAIAVLADHWAGVMRLIRRFTGPRQST